jgi:hypothetical protein
MFGCNGNQSKSGHFSRGKTSISLRAQKPLSGCIRLRASWIDRHKNRHDLQLLECCTMRLVCGVTIMLASGSEGGRTGRRKRNSNEESVSIEFIDLKLPEVITRWSGR